jgi:hypothetical protein
MRRNGGVADITIILDQRLFPEKVGHPVRGENPPCRVLAFVQLMKAGKRPVVLAAESRLCIRRRRIAGHLDELLVADQRADPALLEGAG